MKNIALFNLSDIKIIFPTATLLNFASDWTAKGVSTDSRKVLRDNLFIAIQGPNFDGHNFIYEAFSKHVAAIIISEAWYNENKIQSIQLRNPTIIVKDTIEALCSLAAYHRDRFNIPIIAVTGSNGKTTTKEILYSILSQKFKVLKTAKNQNNNIGVSMNLLKLDSSHNCAIIEIGTNSLGEISKLVDVTRPTDGLITNIGLEHLENLQDIDGVEFEETMLFGKLNRSGSRCFINFNDERLKKYKDVIGNSISYELLDEESKQEADFSVAVQFDSNLHPILSLKHPIDDNSTQAPVTMQASGLAYALNATAAAAVGYGMGLNYKEISQGLERFVPIEDEKGYARMVIENVSNWHILNDCYNANPSSMELSLETLHMFTNANFKVAILGDMFELGDYSHQGHINVIKYALKLADEVIVIGQNMQKAAFEVISENFKANLRIFKNFYEIVTHFQEFDENIVNGVAMLVKGSRSMEMEVLIHMLKQARLQPTTPVSVDL